MAGPRHSDPREPEKPLPAPVKPVTGKPPTNYIDHGKRATDPYHKKSAAEQAGDTSGGGGGGGGGGGSQKGGICGLLTLAMLGVGGSVIGGAGYGLWQLFG